MPNWVTNELSISGPADQKEKFFEAVKGPESAFDFRSIIPMPETLNIVSGGDTDLACFAYLLQNNSFELAAQELLRILGSPAESLIVASPAERIKRMQTRLEELQQKPNAHESRGVILNGNTAPETFQEYVDWGKIYVENYRKYGVMDWYDWCNQNWGTKWNACYCRTIEEDPEIYFDTAWSPPDGIVDALPGFLMKIGAPDVRIYWRWAEEQGFSAGTYDITVNDILEDTFEENEAAYEICEELLGYSAADDEDEEDSDNT